MTIFRNTFEIIRSKCPDKVLDIPSVQKLEIKLKKEVFERATEDEIKRLILGSSSRPNSYKRAEHCLDIHMTGYIHLPTQGLRRSRTLGWPWEDAYIRPPVKTISS